MGLYDSFQLSNADYVPTYAGLPLDQIKQTGDVLAARHYENLAKESQLGLLAQQQKANAESDADKAYIDGHLKGIQSALSDLAKNGGENSTAKVAALTNSFLGDEGLITIQKNIQARQREKDSAEKLRVSGKTPIFNEAYRERFKNQGSFNPESGKWETYDPTVQERLDYMQRQDEVVAPLTSDTYQTDLQGDVKTTLNALGAKFTGDLANMPTQLRTTVINELSKKKVHNFINSGGWASYKDSGEYKQQKEILGMSDAQIKAELISRGEAKVFQKVAKDWVTNKAFDFKAAQKTTEVPMVAGEQLANEPIEYKEPLGNLNDFDYRDRGGFETNVADPSKVTAPGVVRNPHDAPKYTGTQKGISPQRWNQFNSFAQAGAEIFGGETMGPINEKSSKEDIDKAKAYASQYQSILKDRQIYMIQDVSFTQREGEEGRSNADDITKDVRNNIQNRAIYDMDGKKLIPITNRNGEFSDDFVNTIGGRNNITVTGSLDPKNYVAKHLKNPEFADAYTAIIEDPKDPAKTRSVLITRKKYAAGQQSVASVVNKAINHVYSTVNIEPGIEKTISVFGKQAKAKELLGNQWTNYLKELSPEEQATAANYQMPILATVPGESEPLLFDGPDHLVEYLRLKE